MAIVGTALILLLFLVNLAIALMFGAFFITVVNYAIPLSKKDNLVIISTSVLIGLIVPRIIVFWFFKV